MLVLAARDEALALRGKALAALPVSFPSGRTPLLREATMIPISAALLRLSSPVDKGGVVLTMEVRLSLPRCTRKANPSYLTEPRFPPFPLRTN